jgi:hypothetical protein
MVAHTPALLHLNQQPVQRDGRVVGTEHLRRGEGGGSGGGVC